MVGIKCPRCGYVHPSGYESVLETRTPVPVLEEETWQRLRCDGCNEWFIYRVS